METVLQEKGKLSDLSGLNPEEVVEYLQSHDVSEDLLQAPPTQEAKPQKKKLKGVSLRLPEGVIESIERRASYLGIGATTLMRMMLVRQEMQLSETHQERLSALVPVTSNTSDPADLFASAMQLLDRGERLEGRILLHKAEQLGLSADDADRGFQKIRTQVDPKRLETALYWVGFGSEGTKAAVFGIGLLQEDPGKAKLLKQLGNRSAVNS